MGLGTEVGRVGQRHNRIFAIWIGVSARERAARAPPLHLVERNPVQPGGELRPFLKPGEPPPRTKKHLLGDLVGLIFAESEAPQRTAHAVGVEHDPAPRRLPHHLTWKAGACRSPVEVGEPDDTGEAALRIRDDGGLEIALAQALSEFADVGVEPDR